MNPMEQMNRLTFTALAALLTACGGGSIEQAAEPVAVQASPEKPAPVLLNPNCTEVANYVTCDLVVGESGIGVAEGKFAYFTNRTGYSLQVSTASAVTGERGIWSEFCAYSGDFITAQHVAGFGEVGCSTKNVGEDYDPIRFGSGLVVQPGGVLYLNSGSAQGYRSHRYSLNVAPYSSGVDVWRLPKVDKVFTCNGLAQSTEWGGWQNTTGRALQVSGASIYAESGHGNRVSGAACIHVLNADGSIKQSNCDDSLRSRGEVDLSMTVAPGEFIAGQAVNTCESGASWDWAAFLRVY